MMFWILHVTCFGLRLVFFDHKFFAAVLLHRCWACQFTPLMSNFGIGWAQRLHLTTPVAADAAQPLTIRQRPEKTLPYADWLIQDGSFIRKLCNFVRFNNFCIAQLNENVTIFCFTVYFASLHVVNQQKVRLLPEVVKPSMVVYDTVVECDLSRQKSRTCAEAVPRL